MRIGFKKLIMVVLLMLGLFSFSNFVYGSSESSNINIQMTVPTPVVEPGDPGPGGSDSAPVISNVVTSTSANSAVITWIVTDDKGLSSVNFYYSADMSYGLTTTTIGAYQVNLSNLTEDTIYYFKIVATDIASNVTEYAGTLKTSLDSVKSLKIYAKAEKRVPKIGGNLALFTTVILYDPSGFYLPYSLNVSLDKTGSSTLYNVIVPNGTNLEAVIKGQSHLARKIIGVNIQNGQDIFLDFSEADSVELLAGDVQGTGLKDNFVDILDVSAENVNYNNIGLNEDLNRDGVVDILDMSIVLTNFNLAGVLIPS
ncbi:MAG: hypothetical protein COU29_02250 [Candidatus Magasanikbacteria bacterium CG10_big_fil_rev_8_21_14_0_10_36_32]|uniref:Fibronectin type-III domain-containing protein n=1 Tax=Candidatus Magasanikbacteria bacterium CG10_big_fil_rev_8_21_14_0_10_36_32 TaxID=1974646 RepID=A0A2M6W743_9BACT|nr:MAG: hypothetical protein COU29_02250 [Candidatus Magasanikbacteria bacterium CG10_big_fil_rev_8_21_14_0_10_36_32]